MTCWKDILKVTFSNNYSIISGYRSVEPDFAALTRGSAYTYQDFTIAQDTLTISTDKKLAMLIDEADRYQQSYTDWMEMADYQGQMALEYIEGVMLAAHTSWKDFGATDLANTGDDDTTRIDVSATTIDNIILAIKRKINANYGTKLAIQNGLFIVWRPQDWEALESFVMANGYNIADLALKNGVPAGTAFHYMGVDHYLSTSHTAYHVFAGIKKCGEIGILTGTWGQVKKIEEPGLVSGLGVVSRIDYGFLWPTPYAEFFIDVNCN
jgi:hypothetical protein